MVFSIVYFFLIKHLYLFFSYFVIIWWAYYVVFAMMIQSHSINTIEIIILWIMTLIHSRNTGSIQKILQKPITMQNTNQCKPILNKKYRVVCSFNRFHSKSKFSQIIHSCKENKCWAVVIVSALFWILILYCGQGHF